MFLSLPTSMSLVLTCLLYYSWSWRPLHLPALHWSLFTCVTVSSCQKDAILDPLLPLPLPLTRDNFTTDYMQFSNDSCADNSLILFPPINLTSLFSNQSSVHSSSRSLLRCSYQFTLHASQHHSLFFTLQIFQFISFSHSTITPYPHVSF